MPPKKNRANTILNRKAHQAACAVVECSTLGDAAARVGVHQRTMRRWLELPAFQELVSEASRTAYRHAISRMRALCSKACGTLDIAMDGHASSTQVRAALGVLDFSAKADLADIEARLSRLEATRTP